MAVPILLPIIGYSVLCVLVSYVLIRLYRSRGAYSNVLPNPVSSFKLARPMWWDWRRSLTWPWPTSRRKAKPSKHTTVDLLPVTGLPPPPTALPITPPLVDISSASIPRSPSFPSFYQHINKQINSLHSTSFPRPPSPHALLATTSPQKHPRRSRSLGGVPVRRLSGGASGLRNVQFLDRDIEMQKMDRSTSREHLLIDFSSSGSSEELDISRRENEEEVVLSRRVSPASSDIGVLPSHRRPSLFDDAEVPLVDLAPGRKVLPLVDLSDVEDNLGVKKKEEDMWKWFVPPVSGKINITPHESAPVSMVKPISKSISEPLPTTSLPLAMSEGILIDFHSEPDQEHVLVDLDVQDDNNVPQHEFVRVHTTHVDLDAAVSKTAVSLDDPPIIRSALEGRRSLDSLMKPITTLDITTPDPIPVEISSSSVEESSPRGRRVDRHPLEEVHEEKVKSVPEKAESSPATIEDKKQDPEELVNEHELYDHHDHHNDNYAFDKHHDHDHSPQSLDTIRSSSSPQVATIPVQAEPTWYWDHEDDPWNGAVVVNEEDDVEEVLLGERDGAEERPEKVEEGDEKGVDLMEADLEVEEDEDIVKTSPGSKALELPVERSLEEAPTDTLEDEQDEQSYPDPDYLPLPELGRSSPAVATENRLVFVEDGLPNNLQENEENQNDQVEDLQQSKDDEKSPRRAAAQMPTPPASPPPASPLRVKGLGGGPPSLNSLTSMGGLLPLTSISPLSTPQSTSLKLGPSLVLTPPNTASLSPTMEIKVKVPKEDKENARVDKENESPNSATDRPLWSIRADDAPALGLAASSLSPTTSSAGLIPGNGTNTGGSPRARRRVLGDVTAAVENGGREEKVKESTLKDEKDEEDEESSLPGTFPELVKPTNSSDTDTIVAPTITIAALTSTLLTTSIAAASSSISSTPTTTSSTTALETSPPMIKRRPIARSPLDIALAMQLRPGLGVGADPAWMVRFLMAMFGWFAILVSGQGEF